MYYMKVHRSQGEAIVAICDKELQGNTYEEDDLQISVREGFYGDMTASEDDILSAVEKATIVNVVGNRIVDLLSSRKLLNEDNVVTVGGVKHAQIVVM